MLFEYGVRDFNFNYSDTSRAWVCVCVCVSERERERERAREGREIIMYTDTFSFRNIFDMF